MQCFAPTRWMCLLRIRPEKIRKSVEQFCASFFPQLSHSNLDRLASPIDRRGQPFCCFRLVAVLLRYACPLQLPLTSTRSSHFIPGLSGKRKSLWRTANRFRCLGAAENTSRISRRLSDRDREFFLAPACAACFMQQLAQPCASLVKLGFRISDRTTQQRSNFVVFVSFDVVEHEGLPIAGRQLSDGALEMQPIDGARQHRVGSAEFFSGFVEFFPARAVL